MWIQIQFNFDSAQTYKKVIRHASFVWYPGGYYRDLVMIFRLMIGRLGKKVVRYFWLFEDIPNVFLSIELNENRGEESVQEARRAVGGILIPAWLQCFKILEAPEESNGEHALQVFCAGANFAMFRAFDNDYKPHYSANDEHKIIHCFCNTNFVTWEAERRFYFTGLLQRAVNPWEVFVFFFRATYRWGRWTWRQYRATFQRKRSH